MRNILFLLMNAFCLISCEPDGNLTNDDPRFDIGNAVLLSSGTFEPTSGITVTGSAKIFTKNGKRNVTLDGFAISDGPDLKVYLSASDSPSEFINLGALTSATVYAIPDHVDLDDYPYILIHCQRFNHLFAVARMEGL